MRGTGRWRGAGLGDGDRGDSSRGLRGTELLTNCKAGRGSPDLVAVSADRPAAASSSRMSCRMEAAVSGSAAGTSGLSVNLLRCGR